MGEGNKMFGKLIKYDLKSMAKTMIPLWISVLILGGVFSIQIFIKRPDVFNIFIVILFALFTAIFVMNVIFVIQRFWHGLLKEEGYLMFTLPVSERILIISKAVSALMISIGSMVVYLLVAYMIVRGAVGSDWNEMVNRMMQEFEPEISVMVQWGAYGIALSILELLATIYHAYAAMAIGHLSNRYVLPCAFVAYIGLSMVMGFATSWIDYFSMEYPVEGMILLLITVCEILVYHIVTEVILTKKLNLE